MNWSNSAKITLTAINNDLSAELTAEELQYAVEVVCSIVGCKMPNTGSFAILYTSHKAYFPEIGKNQIINAFQMFAAGSLVFDKHPEHYNDYNFAYHSTVLREYIKHRDQVVINARKEVEARNKLNTPPDPLANDNTAILREIIHDFSAGAEDIIQFGAIKYDILDEYKAINLSIEQKNALLVQAKSSLIAKSVASNDAKRVKDINAGLMKPDLKVEAKAIAYMNFIKDYNNLSKVQDLLP